MIDDGKEHAMGFLERLFGMMSGHGGYRGGGHHGGGHGGGYGSYGGTPPGLACPQCGTVNPAGSRFCGQCGSSFAPAKCAACGTELAAGAKFCPGCGKPRA